MRALPDSISRAAVALLLLGLFAAPLARAGAELGARPHSCCPEAPARPDPAPPCQQMAPLSCCLEIGVPPTPAGDGRPPAPELAPLPAPAPQLSVPALRFAAAAGPADSPPLAPLAQTCVLLL